MDSKLEKLSIEEKQEIVKQLNTEVTSIAQEEAKTGQKIDVPNAENLVMMASSSLLKNRRAVANLMPQLSKKALMRAVNAVLDLPTDGVPVFLKSEEEKQLFAHGQRAISDRYVIITHHIKKAIAEDRLKKLQEQPKEEGESNV